MDSFIVLKNDGPQDESRWTNGIHKFLTESGAIVTPEVADELGKETLKTLMPKVQSGQLGEPEFTMALLEAVIPLCPTTASMSTTTLRAASSIMAIATRAMRQLVADMKAGVPLERLRLSAMNLDKVISMAKGKLPKIASSLKSKVAELDKLKAEASVILDQLESPEILTETGTGGVSGSVDVRFETLKDIIDAKTMAVAASKGTAEVGEEGIDENSDADGGEGAQIMFKGSPISQKVISSSWKAERDTRQALALKYYSLKVEISTVKSAAIEVANVTTMFAKMPLIHVERGVGATAIHDQLGDYLETKIKTFAENIASREREIGQVMEGLTKLHNFKSIAKHETMRALDLPMAKLIDMLPKSDWALGNFEKLMDLEEIAQHHSQTYAQQRAKSGFNPDTDKITFDTFAKSFPGANLSKFINSDQKEKIKEVFDEVNAEPGMTWKKGMTISMFSDPPSPVLIRAVDAATTAPGQFDESKLSGQSITTTNPEGSGITPELLEKQKQLKAEQVLNRKRIDNTLKGYIRKTKNPEKVQQYKEEKLRLQERNKAIGLELATLGFDDKVKQLSTGADTYRKSGQLLTRRLFELNRPDPHWYTFLSAVKPRYTNRKELMDDMRPQLDAQQKYEEVSTHAMQGARNPGIKRKIKKNMDEVVNAFDDMKADAGVVQSNSKEIVMAAVDKDSTPSWVLMKAFQYPFDKEVRDLAEFNLLERGWEPMKAEDGGIAYDSYHDMVWKKVAPKAKKAPKGGKKAPAKAPKGTKAPAKAKTPAKKKEAPKAPKAKAKPKAKKTSALSFRERLAQVDMSRNLDQQVETAKRLADDAKKQQDLLTQERQQKMNAPKSEPTPAGQTPPTASTETTPGGNPGAAPVGVIPQGVGVGGVKTFSAKDRLSRRG